ncbi:nascent polypeptide-associated complex protein [Thermoproteus tenax]|uniref:Nascent polypeptide-associated complex protein n=1 Tax=Thermoproteus tenax (strain ATCC 35583 / DSM 2078 / JCM 9277 / NBRC 100435 / Kra 1) TaxID=768679 RepID=G4RNN5_THETK|nr:nascent polypeptide-associated complex protein [Thermoproteus tenax]CCC81179.1 Transcription factor homologous to NACalpha-BTF3 [Thermoproteus tenax Kra 1]
MFSLNPREIERYLKRMGIKMEEVDAAYVEIGLKSGDVLRIEAPAVALIKMPNKTLIYQVQTQEASVRLQKRQPQTQQSQYAPSDEDIALVMEQTGATREEAERALVEAKGDLVQAVMALMNKKKQATST